MVAITIQSRLGNQLFQYFFIVSLAKRLNTSFILNEGIEKFYVKHYFDLKGYSPFLNIVRKIIFKFYNGKLFKKISNLERDSYIFLKEYEKSFPDNSSYGGFYQSESYFLNIINDINKLIAVKHKFQKVFILKYGDYFYKEKIIAVHVRRGDYLNLNDWWLEKLGSNNMTLPVNYYLECFSLIENINSYKVIFVSDDIDYVKQAFGHYENALFSSNDFIIDFQIILNADICIISNSSFAWWASYLNQKKHKKIYCPKYWLGSKIKKEFPEGIIPNTWIQINSNKND